MNAIWLIPPGALQYASQPEPERGLLECHIASVRLRAGVAAHAWKRAGNGNIFHDPAEADGSGPIDWKTASLCVVPKYYYDLPLKPWLDACLAAKSNGVPLVVDICDNPFAKPQPVPEFYSRVLAVCDAVVANSGHMAELMASRGARRPRIIEDAILSPTVTPVFAPTGRVELLWFGHPSNLPYLDTCCDTLFQFAANRQCRLTVVTQEGIGAEEWVEEIQAPRKPGFEARFIPWSLEVMQVALRQCDIVIIPSDPSDSLKAGASANRIAEALNAGRFAVASPLPSYLEFADAAWLGRDLVQGIEWALAHPHEVLVRIKRGQSLVAERFGADRIGRRWCELFDQLGRVPDL